MPYELKALLLCDATSTAPDGKITLYGLFDVITCRELPLRYHQFSIFWKIQTDETGQLTVRIENPDGSLMLGTSPFELKGNPRGRYQGVCTFGGFEFPVDGDYRVVVLSDEKKEIGSTHLIVQKAGTIQ